MKRLLIVEDDPSIRESLVDFFTCKDFVTDATETVDEALQKLSTTTFSAILLDLLLPGRDGLDLLRELRSLRNNTPVIVLTARGEEEQRIKGLELGADDYLVKPFSVRELAARLDAVLRRTGQSEVEIQIGNATIDLAGLEVRKDGTRTRLHQKEAELLAYLYRNAGRAIPRTEILSEVWGYDSFPTTRTVDTHVFNLRKKIEDQADAPAHLCTVHGVGYRLVIEPN